MKIDRVIITIENIDDERASVKLTTEPAPENNEDIEDTPAVTLGSMVWDVVQQFLEEGEASITEQVTLQ
jgi:hypothetical protein